MNFSIFEHQSHSYNVIAEYGKLLLISIDLRRPWLIPWPFYCHRMHIFTTVRDGEQCATFLDGVRVVRVVATEVERGVAVVTAAAKRGMVMGTVEVLCWGNPWVDQSLKKRARVCSYIYIRIRACARSFSLWTCHWNPSVWSKLGFQWLVQSKNWGISRSKTFSSFFIAEEGNVFWAKKFSIKKTTVPIFNIFTGFSIVSELIWPWNKYSLI